MLEFAKEAIEEQEQRKKKEWVIEDIINELINNIKEFSTRQLIDIIDVILSEFKKRHMLYYK